MATTGSPHLWRPPHHPLKWGRLPGVPNKDLTQSLNPPQEQLCQGFSQSSQTTKGDLNPKELNPSQLICTPWSNQVISLPRLDHLSPLKTWLIISYTASTTAIVLSLTEWMQGITQLPLMTFLRSFSSRNSQSSLFNNRPLPHSPPWMLRRYPTTTTIIRALPSSLHNQINALEIANPSSANVSGVMSKDMFYLSVAPSDSSILVSLHLLVIRPRSTLQLLVPHKLIFWLIVEQHIT